MTSFNFFFIIIIALQFIAQQAKIRELEEKIKMYEKGTETFMITVQPTQL